MKKFLWLVALVASFSWITVSMAVFSNSFFFEWSPTASQVLQQLGVAVLALLSALLGAKVFLVSMKRVLGTR